MPLLGSLLALGALGAASDPEAEKKLEALEAKAGQHHTPPLPPENPALGPTDGTGPVPKDPDPDWLSPKGEFEFPEYEHEALLAVMEELGVHVASKNDPCNWPGVKCNFGTTCGAGKGAYKPPDASQARIAERLSWDGGSTSSRAIYLDNAIPGSPSHAPYGCMPGYGLELRNRGFGTGGSSADVPKSIGQLKHLLHLDLSGNKFKRWPVLACGAQNLESLIMDHNELEGELWPEMKDMSKLRVLNLGHNKLTGLIPSEWTGNFPLLTDLHLENNKLRGGVSPLTALPELRMVYLQHNQLSTPLQPWLGQNLIGLHVGYNYISGSVPTFPPTLQFLWLQRNQLVGKLPDLSQNPSLQVLYASHNQLTGPIPQLGSAQGLQEIRLEHNKLSGSIPPGLGQLPQLRTLDLEDNALTGTVPAALGSLPKLHLLYLDLNKLQGNIPATLGQLTGIGKLSLSNNQLSGEVPPAVAALDTTEGRLELEGNPRLQWTKEETTTETVTKYTGPDAEYYPDGAGPGEPTGRKPPAVEEPLELRIAKLPLPPPMDAGPDPPLPTLATLGMRLAAEKPEPEAAPEPPTAGSDEFPLRLDYDHAKPEAVAADIPSKPLDEKLPTNWFPDGPPPVEKFVPGRRSWGRPADEVQPALAKLKKGQSACPRLKGALSYRFSATCTSDPGECTAVVQLGGKDCLTTCFEMDLDCTAMHKSSSCEFKEAEATSCATQGETAAVCHCAVPAADSALGKHLIAAGRWEATAGTKPPA